MNLQTELGGDGFFDTGYTVGQTFPAISLPSLEDNLPRSITQFRGQKTILHIFASW